MSDSLIQPDVTLVNAVVYRQLMRLFQPPKVSDLIIRMPERKPEPKPTIRRSWRSLAFEIMA